MPREAILKLFSQHGRVRHLQLYADDLGSLNSGTVTMFSRSEAVAAMAAVDGSLLVPGVAPLKVAWAQLNVAPKAQQAEIPGATVAYCALPPAVTPHEASAGARGGVAVHAWVFRGCCTYACMLLMREVLVRPCCALAHRHAVAHVQTAPYLRTRCTCAPRTAPGPHPLHALAPPTHMRTQTCVRARTQARHADANPIAAPRRRWRRCSSGTARS
jgi:hypothetical protein